MVAILAVDVPMASISPVVRRFLRCLVGTTISQPGAGLLFFALATVPFIGTSYHLHLGNAISSCKRSLETYLENKLKNVGARNIVTSSKIKTFMASEGGVGDYQDEGLSGTVNYVEIISRAVGDPPEL